MTDYALLDNRIRWIPPELLFQLRAEAHEVAEEHFARRVAEEAARIRMERMRQPDIKPGE